MKLALVAGALALVINPFYACMGDDHFTFSGDDMAAAVDGTWVLTLPATLEAPRRTYTFGIAAERVHRRDDSSLVPSAHACANRSLVASAAACEVQSRLPLHFAVVDGVGWLDAYGYAFDSAALDMTIDGTRIYARLTPTGDVTDVSEGANLERVASRY